MTIKFHSEARKEFFEAAEYYEEQVVGLGDEFLDEVEKVLDAIEQPPASGAKVIFLHGCQAAEMQSRYTTRAEFITLNLRAWRQNEIPMFSLWK